MMNRFDLAKHQRALRPLRLGSSPVLPALLFFTLVSTLMLYPVFSHFSEWPITGGDTYEYLWKLGWFKQSLLTPGTSLWLVPDIYYPHGYLLAYGETTAVNMGLALPLTLWFGEVAAYNWLVLLSTILSGFIMFLLAREISGNAWAGLLAGIIFAFAPFRRLQLLHLNIFTTQWLPLLFYFLEKYVRTRKPVFAAAGGVAFALNALATWYYAVAGVMFGLVWGLVRCRPLTTFLRNSQTWRAAVWFIIPAGVLIFPLAWPYLPVLTDPAAAIPLENSNFYAASPFEYLIPSPVQFWWGAWVRQHLLNRPAPGEFIIGWGFMAWLFGLYGLRYAPKPARRPWLAVTLVAIGLSFGLTLHLAGRQVVIPAPSLLVECVNGLLNTLATQFALRPEPFTLGQADGLIIPLPALALRWFVPVLGSLRTWTRFGLVAMFGMALLAALGAAAWHRREVQPRMSQRTQRLAWGVVIGLALFELWWQPPAPAPLPARPVDDWLAAQPGQVAIMQYPLSSTFTPEQLLYTRIHGQPIVHGYATYFSFIFSRRHPELLNFPAPAAVRQLAGWGVRYVLVETASPYTAEAAALLTAIPQESCLQPRTVQGTVKVFELVGCLP